MREKHVRPTFAENVAGISFTAKTAEQLERSSLYDRAGLEVVLILKDADRGGLYVNLETV